LIFERNPASRIKIAEEIHDFADDSYVEASATKGESKPYENIFTSVRNNEKTEMGSSDILFESSPLCNLALQEPTSKTSIEEFGFHLGKVHESAATRA